MCAQKSSHHLLFDAPQTGNNDLFTMLNDDDIEENEGSFIDPQCSYEPVEVDLSQHSLDTFPVEVFTAKNSKWHPHAVSSLNLTNNVFVHFPLFICRFKNIISLDLSNNHVAQLPVEVGNLTLLRQLALRNNLLEDLPKQLSSLTHLEELNLSGNRFEQVPTALLRLTSLKQLYLGGNRLTSVPPTIANLFNLEILYLGGNRLEEVPVSLGNLRRLSSLALADNLLEEIPSSFADLRSLRSLSLHNNRIRVLPTVIARLRQLEHLSLRNNPLVTDFVNDTELAPPSLKELSGRIVKIKIPLANYSQMVPRDLIRYLNSANRCINPKCKGVYFDSCAELVKFVDFCGKYRVPLLHYLCSSKCSTVNPAYAGSSSESEDEGSLPSTSRAKMKKILIG